MRLELYKELIKLREKHNISDSFIYDVELEKTCYYHSKYMSTNKTICHTPEHLLVDSFECISVVDLYDSMKKHFSVIETIIEHIEDNKIYLNNILKAKTIEAFITVDHHTFYCCIHGR